MQKLWTWLTSTDAGLLARVAVGSAIFLILALVDLRERGRRATRWREYLFLLAGAAAGLLYGAVNDLITCRISWEYFYYGKGLAQALGPQTPPEPGALAWQAAKVGMKAAWSAGLLAAAVILIANNPRPGLPQIPYRRLFWFLPGIVICCIVCACGCGIAGAEGLLSELSTNFREMVQQDLFRPFRFMAVFGVHLGGYVGGIVGTAWAALRIRRGRKMKVQSNG